MKWNYTIAHNVAAAAVSLTVLILTIIFVDKLNSESMPEVPRAFERLKTFYLAETVRLTVYAVFCCRILSKNNNNNKMYEGFGIRI